MNSFFRRAARRRIVGVVERPFETDPETMLELGAAGFDVSRLPEGHPARVQTASQQKIPVDYRAIAAITSGVTTWLIGDQSNPGVIQSSPVPDGMALVVYGIFPYLEATTGSINQVRPPGNGTVITWSCLVNGRPDSAYGSINYLITEGSWSEGMSDVPLMYLRAGERLSAFIQVTDPNTLYTYGGLRVAGMLFPVTELSRTVPVEVMENR